MVWQRDRTALAWETQVRGTTDAGEPSWQFVYVDAGDGSVLESREQIAHGTGTAAYSGPNPLSIATSGSGSSFTMTDPTATTLKCQDAATNVTFSGTDDAWGNGNATSKETGCVDALLRRPADEGDDVVVARPQRHERLRRLGPDPGRASTTSTPTTTAPRSRSATTRPTSGSARST